MEGGWGGREGELRGNGRGGRGRCSSEGEGNEEKGREIGVFSKGGVEGSREDRGRERNKGNL